MNKGDLCHLRLNQDVKILLRVSLFAPLSTSTIAHGTTRPTVQRTVYEMLHFNICLRFISRSFGSTSSRISTRTDHQQPPHESNVYTDNNRYQEQLRANLDHIQFSPSRCLQSLRNGGAGDVSIRAIARRAVMLLDSQPSCHPRPYTALRSGSVLNTSASISAAVR